MRRLSLPLIAAFATTAPSQVDDIQLKTRRLHVDSGYRDNTSARSRVVARRDITVLGAAWLRVFFDQTNLPRGSELRLTSRKDGAVQRHDAHTLRDYSNSSAYFNGDRVTIELIAAPGTRANRFLIVKTEFHRAPLGAPDSICGRTDDRKLQKDVRIGRAITGASGCTWWIIDEFTILTAGHCVRNASNPILVGFNIPLSTSNGTYVQPPPSDQYPAKLSSLRSRTGIGTDWAVAATERNSNHGLYAGQRQGAWFKLGPVPASPSGVTIRITGNGWVTSPVSPTWNAVTKTHTGPCVRTSSYVQYKVDTTGGNSGSPIIHEQTGRAIGIHTHGGCLSNGTGQNSGTRIDRAALQSAIKAVRSSRTVGFFRKYGTSCGPTSGQPTLGMSGIPDIGRRTFARISGLPKSQPGFILLGGSDKTWSGQALPLRLDFMGFRGCRLLTSVDAMLPLATGNGTVIQSFSIPNSTSLIGVDAYLQYMAALGTSAVFSDAAQVRIGN